MSGMMHTFHTDQPAVSGYLAKPAGGTGPGVLVIQEWWGLVPHIQTVCDRFAAEGYVAFAPDLYHGETTTAPDQAGKLMMSLRLDEAEAELAGAIAGLRSLPETQGFATVGSIGFCMGGVLSLHAACKNPAIGACVIFYGGFPGVKPDLPALQAPVLGIYAGLDTFVTPDSVRELEAELNRLGKPNEIHLYPEADHAFFNDTRPAVYRAGDAHDAWRKVLAFYQQHLRTT